MIRKLLMGLIVALLTITGLTVSQAPAANAEPQSNQTDTSSEPTNTGTSEEEPATCEGADTTKGTGECGDIVKGESHSKSSARSRAVAVNGVSLTSNVTVLANIRANGTPAAQQTDCYRIPRAMSLWTSYNAEGTTGWHWKYYPKGYRFCRINGAVRDPKCHNQVKIGVPHSRPPKNAISGKVKFVQRLKWEVKAVAKADEKVTTFAKAWCTTQSAYAYGEAKGMAEALAVGRGSAKGYVLSKLYAQAEVQAAGNLSLQLEGRSVVQVRAKVRATAFAKATSTASAKAVCKDTPQQPTDNPPVINIYGTPAHLYTGGTAALWIEASDADNDALQVSVKAAGDNTCKQEAGKYTTNCVTGLIPVDIRWDGTPCPAGVKCYRATAWAGNTPGTFTVIATVTANGKTVSNDVSFPIVADEF